MQAAANPYIAGKALRNAKAFFGRRDVFDLVHKVFRSPDRNAIVLFGQRRIGKTSILLQLKHRLPKPRFVPIYFDLMDYAKKPLGTLLFDLASAMASEIDIDMPNSSQSDDEGIWFRKEFLPQLYEKAGPDCRPILLLDEFDVLDQSAEEDLPRRAAALTFFPYVRALMNSEPFLGFVFVVGRKAEDLSVEFKATFKAARYRRVSVLAPEDARELVLTAQRDGSLSFADAAVDRILDLTAGHPFFIQLVCQVIWDAKGASNDRAVTPDDIDITRVLEAGENVFEWIWDGLPPAERVIFSAIAHSTDGSGSLSRDQLADILQGHGIRILSRELEIAPDTLVDWEMLRNHDGKFQFFIELMRLWVAVQKPLEKVKAELYRINPLAESLYQSGNGFYRKGDLTNSIELLRHAITNNPNHLKARLLLAQILIEQSKVPEAITELEQAHRYDPNEVRHPLVRALLTRAEELERAGEIEEALAAYVRVLDLSPGERTALEQRDALWIRCGDNQFKLGNFAESIEWYRKANANDKVAEVEKTIRQKAMAALAIQAAEAETREDWTGAAEVYEHMAREDAGNEAWAVALRRARDMSDLERRYLEGVAALDRGEWVQAQRALADVVNLRPDYKDAAEGLARGVRSAREGAKSVEQVPIRPTVKIPRKEARAGSVEIVVRRENQGASNGPLARLPVSNAPVLSVAVSSRTIAAAGMDGLVKLWALDGLEPLTIIPHARSVQAVAFSVDGALLAAAGGDHTIHLWSASEQPKRLAELKHQGAVTGVDFSPDGRYLGAGSSTGYIAVWSVPDARQVVLAGKHVYGDTLLRFLPVGFRLKNAVAVTAGADGVVRIWDQDYREISSLGNGATPTGSYSPARLGLPSPVITAIACTPDGSRLLWGNEDGSLSVTKGKSVIRSSVTRKKVTSVASCGSRFVALGSWDSAAVVREVDEQRNLDLLVHPGAVNSVAYHAGRSLLITGCDDGAVRVWDLSGHVAPAPTKSERTT
jgi:WD40 repeat protein/tetratricopeptide (TPR) repeat protein